MAAGWVARLSRRRMIATIPYHGNAASEESESGRHDLVSLPPDRSPVKGHALLGRILTHLAMRKKGCFHVGWEVTQRDTASLGLQLAIEKCQGVNRGGTELGQPREVEQDSAVVHQATRELREIILEFAERFRVQGIGVLKLDVHDRSRPRSGQVRKRPS